MRFKLLILAAATVAAAALWAVTDSRSTQHASQRQIRQLQANLDELQAGLRRHSVTAMGTAMGAGASATGDVASLARREARAEAQRAIDERSGSDEPKSAKPPAVTIEQSQAAVLEAFEQEGSDPQWSADAARKLQAAIREHLPKGSRLGSIECHTTMCQVEVVHTDPNASQMVLANAFRDWPGSLFVANDRQGHGENAVTIIASREGHEPPFAPR